jgi:dCMP deaminase
VSAYVYFCGVCSQHYFGYPLRCANPRCASNNPPEKEPTVKDYIDNWDEFWMGMAFMISRKSKDPSTKLGVVLVTTANDLVSVGWNGFPRGVREEVTQRVIVDDEGSYRDEVIKGLLDDERWEKRPEKYRWVEHAERNAVYNAARLGRPTLGTVAYINADPTPCSDCTRSFIQAGVHKIVGINKPFTGKGTNVHYHCGAIENTMLDEAGIKRVRLEWPPRG